MRIPRQTRPRLAGEARLHSDPAGGVRWLLSAEHTVELDEVAWAVLQLVDGERTLDSILSELEREFEAPPATILLHVEDLLLDLQRTRLIEAADVPFQSEGTPTPHDTANLIPRAVALLAEVTYRCPLHCPYCSNPVAVSDNGELNAGEWARVFTEAAALGIVQAGISGGEPLVRSDLEQIVASARAAGLYTNLLTSGVGLDPQRIARLRGAGLEAVQLSIQADEPALADFIAGAKAHEAKRRAAGAIIESGLKLGLNVVLHRANIARVPEIIAMAVGLRASRIELANTQYYGWALLNRTALMPTPAQAAAAWEAVDRAREQFGAAMEIAYVAPDYIDGRPKRCMQGWGLRYMVIAPAGEALPCTGARIITSMHFENVRRRSLDWIWRESPSFNRFRGTAWMPEPCASCEMRDEDLGGCRCQAFFLIGRADATDPVCRFSPDRPLVNAAIDAASADNEPFQMRKAPTVFAT
jgi:PqqA peptide cyclase